MLNKYAFFDFDNTLSKGYSVSSFYLFLAEQRGPEFLARVQKEHNQLMVDYAEKKVIDYNKAAVWALNILGFLLENMGSDKVDMLTKKFADKYIKNFFPYSKQLLKYLTNQGFEIIIVSASPDFLIETFLTKLNIKSKSLCSSFQTIDGKYTGKLKIFLNAANKMQAIENITKMDHTITIAFGDSMGDLDMLQSVNRGFLINSSELLLGINSNVDKIIVIKEREPSKIIDFVSKNISSILH